MQAALYGKHPAWGDFVQAGLPPQVLRTLEVWLDTILSDARADLGPLWEEAWNAAPILRFWIGEAVFGAVACGVMASSQDRVGRHYPLLMLAVGAPEAAPAPPVIDASQGWYQDAEAHLRRALSQAKAGDVADLMAGFPLPLADAATGGAGASDFWAVLPGTGLETLLADVALTDHRRAAAARSYWWVEGDAVPGSLEEAPPTVEPPTGPENADDLPPGLSVLPPPRPSRIHAGAGLPSGAVLSWFLRS